MYVNGDFEIEIDKDDMAEAIVDSRYFTNAVEAVVERMDLNDILDAPSRSDVEIIVEDMGVPTSDDVYDIAREVVRDEVSNYLSVSKFLSSSAGKQVLKQGIVDALEDLGITDSLLAARQAQARIEALERQVLRLEGTLARVADVLLGKPVERIVSAAINSTED